MSDSSISLKTKSFFKDRANLFVIRILIVYASWRLLYHVFTNSDGFMGRVWISIISAYGSTYAFFTSKLLNLIGEKTYSEGINIHYISTNNMIYVAEHCLALPATVIFIGSIAIFTGSWKNKIWFITLGVFCIFMTNLIRLVSVCEAFNYGSPALFYIHHRFVSLIATYSIILGMIVWWMRKYSTPEGKLEVRS